MHRPSILTRAELERKSRLGLVSEGFVYEGGCGALVNKRKLAGEAEQGKKERNIR